jgi:hypothetical protein
MKEDQPIKAGFCVAYDWKLLRSSLPLIYQQADSICLSLDKDRISWAGLPFQLDERAFLTFVSELDVEKKIQVYEDDFHLPSLTPMENEVRQRNLMAKHLGAGGWHIQLDADEYMINFEGFVAHLRSLRLRRPSNIHCAFFTLFKKVKGGYLLIRERSRHFNEFFPVATQHPAYKYGRRNDDFNYKSNFAILHQSWAREEEEIREKIRNWGHKEDFDVEAYFRFWQGIDALNYHNVTNFHPIKPELWQRLEFIAGEDVNTLIGNMGKALPTRYSGLHLSIENNIWYKRFHSLLKTLKEG